MYLSWILAASKNGFVAHSWEKRTNFLKFSSRKSLYSPLRWFVHHKSVTQSRRIVYLEVSKNLQKIPYRKLLMFYVQIPFLVVDHSLVIVGDRRFTEIWWCELAMSDANTGSSIKIVVLAFLWVTWLQLVKRNMLENTYLYIIQKFRCQNIIP